MRDLYGLVVGEHGLRHDPSSLPCRRPNVTSLNRLHLLQSSLIRIDAGLTGPFHASITGSDPNFVVNEWGRALLN